MVTENFGMGGKERRIIELLKKLEALPSIFCEVIILKDQIEYADIYNFKKIRITILSRKIKKDPAVFFKLYRLIKAFKPDIVHSWGPMPSVYVSPITFLLGIRLINNMISNASAKRFSSNWLRAKLSFPFSRVILSNSLAGLEAYAVKPPKGRVIYNGFDFKRLKNLEDPATVREKYGIGNRFVVGMVGAFHERKDFGTFLAAAGSIAADNGDFCFVAAGKGPDLDHFRRLYGSGFEGKIILPGPVEDIESLINIFDVGVLATNSRVHQEGISNAIIEYMACGKPVIATQGGGTGEIIMNNKNGLLIEPLSVEALTKAIRCLYNDPELRFKLGRNARETIINTFSIDNMVQEYLEVYRSLIEE